MGRRPLMLPAVAAYPAMMAALAAMPVALYGLLLAPVGYHTALLPGGATAPAQRVLGAFLAAALLMWLASRVSRSWDILAALMAGLLLGLMTSARPIYQAAFEMAQLGMLAQLAVWWSETPGRWERRFILAAAIPHAVATLLLFPVCQVGAGWMAWLTAQTACGAWWGSAWNPQLILVLVSAAAYLLLLGRWLSEIELWTGRTSRGN